MPASCRRGDGGLSLPSQRQHALELSVELRDRCDPRSVARGDGRLFECLARRNLFWRQRHHARIPHGAGYRADAQFRRRNRRYRAGSSCQRRPVASTPARTRHRAQACPLRHRFWIARLERLRGESYAAHQADRRRCRVECAGHDQRHGPRRQTCQELRRPAIRRRRPFCPSPARRCPGDRLRFSHLLGLQVLWSTRGRDVLPSRAARFAAVRQGGPRIERGPRTRRNGYAQPRGHRRRRSGRRFPGLACRELRLAPRAARQFVSRTARTKHATARTTLERPRDDRRRDAVTARNRTPPAPRRSRLRSPASRPARLPGNLPQKVSSSPTATSTR